MPAPTTCHLSPRSPRRLARTTLALALALLLAPRFAAADDKAGTTTGGGSVMDGFRSLGQQISDPKTPDRLKAHEQEFEKNVQGTRDQQRRAHPGELRASDATGMANDPKMGGPGARSGASHGTGNGTKSTAKSPGGDAPGPTKSGPKPKASATKTNSAAAAPAEAAKAPPKAPPPPAR